MRGSRRPALAVVALASALALPGLSPAGASAKSFTVNTRASKPSSVSQNRFAYSAYRGGKHWGGHIYDGRTSRRPDVLDGRNVVGFSYRVSGDVAATTTGWDCFEYMDGAGRPREHCREFDIAVNPRVPWEDGPSYPSRGRVDLLSVVIHEFGHFSGFPNHVPRCSNSPMVEVIYSGEWWRSSSDFSWRNCGTRSRPATRSSSVPLRGYTL